MHWNSGRSVLVALMAASCLGPTCLMAQNVSPGTKHGEERTFEVLEMKIQTCWCPKGKFVMCYPEGGIIPVKECGNQVDHQLFVKLSRGFWMGKFEVTQKQWDDVMKTFVKNPSTHKAATFPVEGISFAQATQFCEKLTKVARDLGQLPHDWEYRLPTEAQWDYACRAGATTAYSFGDDAKLLRDYAWYRDNSGQKGHPVGQKKPNGWGLYDMHGNVTEYCRDWLDLVLPGGVDPETVTEPYSPEGQTFRVVRGGSQEDSAESCQVACRGGCRPEAGGYLNGFRVALVQSGD
jgi:formylglycine-generating enzyme required for sulfatase activity